MKRNQLLLDFYKYVWLNIIGMLGLSFYILVDTYFIANGVGAQGLTSLNLVIPAYSLIHGTGLMLGIGGATRYNIQKSGNSKEQGNQTYTTTVWLGLISGFIYMGIGIALSKPLAELLGADKDILPMTSIYLKTILIFSPCFILNNILVVFIRNDGGPKTAMLGMLIGSLGNVLLDYVFIFPLGMGMFGAALATIMAPVISMAVMIPYFTEKKNQFHFQRKNYRFSLCSNICSLGVSAFVSEIASGVVLIVFNLILLSLSGNIAVAAYGVVANLSIVAISLFTGIGQGIQPLVSHYYGAGKISKVQRLLRYAIVLSYILVTIVYAFILLFSDGIVELFNKDNNEVLKTIATNGLTIYFAGFFFAGINIVLSAYFSAIEMPKIGFTISILRGLIVIVPLAIVLSRFWGVTGVWLTFPIGEAMVFVVGVAQAVRARVGKQVPDIK